MRYNIRAKHHLERPPGPAAHEVPRVVRVAVQEEVGVAVHPQIPDGSLEMGGVRQVTGE